MIRRHEGLDFLLIAQHDHALLAGHLTLHIGNELFAPPSPLSPVVHAVAQHDCGWQSQDDRPTLNPQGSPSHVFEISHEIALAAWSRSVEEACAADPYAALLVSLHTMNLAALAAEHLAKPVTPQSRQELFKIHQFHQRQVEIQQSLRQRLAMRTDLALRLGLARPGAAPEEDLLLANFHLLELLDQLSLVLCFDRLVFREVQNVFPRPGESPVTVRFERDDDDGAVHLDPWPFDEPRIDLQVPAKRLPAVTYENEDHLRTAYAAAPSEILELSVRRMESE
ncbi:MAG: DUF3891 family protein [Tepidisphaeraceae bacterium]|jgi:hypothetical protein